MSDNLLAFRLYNLDRPVKTPSKLENYIFEVFSDLRNFHKQHIMGKEELVLYYQRGEGCWKMGDYILNRGVFVRYEFDYEGWSKFINAGITADTIDQKSEEWENIFIKTMENIAQDIENTKRKIIELRNLILEAPPTTKDFYVYRGENIEDYSGYHLEEIRKSLKDKRKERKIFKVNDTFENRLFTSFSLNPKIAVEFLDKSNCCLYRMNAKKETPKLIFPKGLIHDYQKEILFPPAIYKVIAIHTISPDILMQIPVRVYDVEIISIPDINTDYQE